MPNVTRIDATDRRLIRALQKSGRMTNIDLADEINLSPSPCLRRLRNLEEKGVIRGYSVDVDAASYGLPITVFVRVALEGHAVEVAHADDVGIRWTEIVHGAHDGVVRVGVAFLFVDGRIQVFDQLR